MPPLHVFEWSAWTRFLITYVAPGAERVMVTPGRELCTIERPILPGLMHVNLSRPRAAFPDYERWLASYQEAGLPLLNGHCLSIDKWAIQDACAAAGLPTVRASREGDPDEHLIIKVRANHLGEFERSLPLELAGGMMPPPWPYPERVHRAKRRDLPSTVWHDARIAVERYVSNREGRFQRAYVVGDYVAVATSASPELVKEMDHSAKGDLISTTAASAYPLDRSDPFSIVSALTRGMRIDFAAIDLAIDDAGIIHPIDLNTTPWGEDAAEDSRLIEELGMALNSLVTGSGHRSQECGIGPDPAGHLPATTFPPATD